MSTESSTTPESAIQFCTAVHAAIENLERAAEACPSRHGLFFRASAILIQSHVGEMLAAGRAENALQEIITELN